MPDIGVLVADDHELVRSGLVLLLSTAPGIRVVAQASDGEQCVAAATIHHPDLVLMDLKMPRLDGLAATRRLKICLPSVKVVLLTGVEDAENILEATSIGADGYLLKTTSSEELIRAIRSVAAGEAYLQPAVTRQLFDRLLWRPRPDPPPNLGVSPREIEVLRLMATTSSNREIAEKLVVSEETVRSHIKSILRKLGQPDRTQAVLAGIRHGIVKLE
ncbi:MAG: response regulator [Chloroflexota bacterium]